MYQSPFSGMDPFLEVNPRWQVFHGWFVRKLAEQNLPRARELGCWIDVERSVSRVMPAVAPREQVLAARRVRQLLAKVNKARDLIQLGAYAPGHDAELDLAVRLQPQINALLQQDMHDRAALDASQQQLLAVAGA